MNQKKMTLVEIVVMAVVLLLFSPSVFAEEGEEPELVPGDINSCGAITLPGTYTLIADIDATGIPTCFEISISDVTLEGNGFSIVSDGLGEGVYAHGQQAAIENILVRNIELIHFASGIRYMHVISGEIVGTTISDSVDTAVTISGSKSDSILIKDNTLERNGRAISLLQGVKNVHISNNVIEANTEAGLKAMGTSFVNFTHNDVRGHTGEKAIHFTGHSEGGHIITYNTIVDNAADPFDPLSAGPEYALQIGGENGGSTLAYNTVANNGRGGISLGSPGNTVEYNTILNNGAIGLYILSENIIRENTIDNNAGFGIAVEGSTNIIMNNVVNENGRSGILLAAGIDNIIRDETLIANNEFAVQATSGVEIDAVGITLDSRETVVDVTGTSIAFTAPVSFPSLPKGRFGIDRYVVVAQTGIGAAGTVTLYYSEEDAEDIAEQNLALWSFVNSTWQSHAVDEWFYDAEGWTGEKVTLVNDEENFVTFTIPEFGVLTVIEESSSPPFEITDVILSSDFIQVGETVTITTSVSSSVKNKVRFDLIINEESVDQLHAQLFEGENTLTFTYLPTEQGIFAVEVSGFSGGTLLVNGTLDLVPPTTEVQNEAGFLSWTEENVSVLLACTDLIGEGCAMTYYCIDTLDVCVPDVEYSLPVNVTEEGRFFRYYSVDVAGNVEEVHSAHVLIDRTSPNFFYSFIGPTMVTQGELVHILLKATDGTSGIAQVEALVDNESVFISAENLGVGIFHGHLDTANLSLGNHVLSLVVQDTFGHYVENLLVFTVTDVALVEGVFVEEMLVLEENQTKVLELPFNVTIEVLSGSDLVTSALVTMYTEFGGVTSLQALGKYLDISLPELDETARILIRMHYSDELVSRLGLVESSLRFSYYNETSGVWEQYNGNDGEVPDGGVDIENNTVWALTNHLSSWGVFGTLVSAETTPQTSTSRGGGGGSGGGSGGCIPQWDCTDWSVCTSEAVQTRTCTLLTSWCTTSYQPVLEQSCTPQEVAPQTVEAADERSLENSLAQAQQATTPVEETQVAHVQGVSPAIGFSIFGEGGTPRVPVIVLSVVLFAALVFGTLYWSHFWQGKSRTHVSKKSAKTIGGAL